MIVRHFQELFSATGEHYGTGIVTVEGRRWFGGKVLFDPEAEPVVTGAALPEDRDYLRHFARNLLEVLQTLCKCGGLPGNCSCCLTCAGLGHSAGESGARTCETCAGGGLQGPADSPAKLDRF